MSSWLRSVVCLGTLLSLALAWGIAQAEDDSQSAEEVQVPSDSMPSDEMQASDETQPADEMQAPDEVQGTDSSGVEFTDVPEHHWAYEAIDYLQQLGLVEGYPDGTFHGDRPFTRYEMAMVVARIFTKMEDWQAMNGAGTLPPASNGQSADISEVYARLDRLSDEFRDELSAMGARITAVEDEQTRMRDEIGQIRELVKESGLSGTVRWRTGSFISTGSASKSSDVGFEQEIRLNYQFQPEPGTDFHLSMTSYENEGPVSDGSKPGQNNETGSGNPPGLPDILRRNSSSFVVDEAYAEYCWDQAPSVFGDTPVITIGRHYFSEGEFGLAGDNGWRSTFGLRGDFAMGKQIDAYAALYRPDSVEQLGPFENADTNSFQSSAITASGDDYLLAGLEFHKGEAKVPGHDYQIALRGDFAPSGYGKEKYFGLSGNAEIPWFGDNWLNGIRGEWVMVNQNAAGQNPGDLGLTNSSFIVDTDLYNSGDTRFSVSFAQIAQIEALPAFANIDNDPFSEWDFSMNATADAFNFSREGRNMFPSDFSGFGVQAEHAFGGNMHGLFSYYQGSRIDAAADSRPGMLRLGLRFPFSNNSQMGVDYIAAGQREGLTDPISLLRGEYRINF